MLAEILILIVVSFAAPVIYLVIIRNSERYEREKWRALSSAFLWGAIPAVILTSILETPFSGDVFILVVFAAPFIEELTKPLGVNRVRKEINELEDGIIFGVACAMGFAAVENVLYVGSFWMEYGVGAAMSEALLRSISSVFLHASATAFTGYGIARALLMKKSMLTVVPYYLLAVFLHGGFNFLASIGMGFQYFEELREVSAEEATLVTLSAILLAIVCFSAVYAMVRRLEGSLSRSKEL